MRKVIKIFCLAILSMVMFWNLVSYIPQDRFRGIMYLIFCAGFSISLSVFIYKSLQYIRYLEERVEELERNDEEQNKP